MAYTKIAVIKMNIDTKEKEIVKTYDNDFMGIEMATQYIEKENFKEENILNGIYHDIEEI